ncbi:MAG: branched-chain amino acid ABC transporter permease [Deltaproteobacteria bacterium]|nr:branched-chain amino acid ABC transporter permease [Deltaproteobacteria bacterium]
MESLLDQSSLFLQQLVNGITLGGVYALIAVGYTMVYGVIQLINFAHGEIYMLGGFLAYTLVAVLGMPFFPAFILTLLICALLGVILDFVAYRPLRKAPRLAALITAIGMSIFLQNMAMLVWGSQIKSYPRDILPAFFSESAITFGDVSLSWLQLFILAITLSSMIILHLTIHKTRIGMAMRAISQDKTASALMGIGVNRVISFTFAIGSAMGGMAGILVGLYYNAIFPTMGYVAGIKAFAAAVLGGIGSVPGAMLGGGVLGIAEVMGAGYISSEYRDGISYAVMIAVILFKPSGLIGKQMGEKV